MIHIQPDKDARSVAKKHEVETIQLASHDLSHHSRGIHVSCLRHFVVATSIDPGVGTLGYNMLHAYGIKINAAKL